MKGCLTKAYTKHAEYGAVLQEPETCLIGLGYTNANVDIENPDYFVTWDVVKKKMILKKGSKGGGNGIRRVRRLGLIERVNEIITKGINFWMSELPLVH
jgi:hypothetical protein